MCRWEADPGGFFENLNLKHLSNKLMSNAPAQSLLEEIFRPGVVLVKPPQPWPYRNVAEPGN
jgi:hypothetical protein